MQAKFTLKYVNRTKADIRKVGKRVEEAARGFVAAASDHMAERAAANAPILTGDLRSSMIPRVPARKYDKIEGGVVDIVPYALEMHEALKPYGTGPYRRGPISRQQPDTPEGGVGGKYIERVAQYHANKYVTDFVRAMQDGIDGKAAPESSADNQQG